ncbi:MAG TPA: ABC transporter permease [Ilumatobacteraceae bacterium]|nr:ABC transporter permease [Ilumatobacteraceae bacterium]
MTEIDHTTDLDIDLDHVASTDVAQAIVTNTDADLTGLSLRDESEGVGGESLSPFRLALRHYKRDRVAMVALIILAIIVLACLFPSIPARYGETERLPKTAVTYINSPPSSKAWFGTDDLNRDLYSRIFYGGRISIMIGIAVAIIACTVGTIVGALAGYRGGWLDDILMRITDVFLAFPILVSLLVLRNVLAELPLVSTIMGEKTSVRFMVILLSAVGWMAVARIVRGVVLSLKEREFVEASRSVGASGPRIMFRHLIPNALGPIMVSLSLSVVGAILAESTLSFFGYGPSPGQGRTTWGLLIAQSKKTVLSGYWWLVVFPCAFLVVTIVCINFVGDGLRDAFDPKSDTSRA